MTQVVAVAGITLCIASYLLKTHQLLLFYPVVVNAVMLSVFGGSLWSAMPIVERLARLRDPNLPDAGVRYTRRVTQIWCAFFIINGSIALFTALNGDMTLWTTERHGFLSANGNIDGRRVVNSPTGDKTRYPMKQPLTLAQWLCAPRPDDVPVAWQEEHTDAWPSAP